MKFEYDAVDANGNEVRGIAEAKNFIAFLHIMYEKRLHPIDVRQLTRATSEIERLNRLKKKIRGEQIEPEIKAQTMSTATPFSELKKDKESFDYSYLIFIVMILGLIALLALSPGFVL